MTREIIMRREGQRLAPRDEMSAEDLALVPAGVDLVVTVRAPRNLRQHKLAWALATKVAEAVEGLHDREDAMDFLKIKAHHFKTVIDPRNGKVYLTPKSISFFSLDQQAFSRLFKRMVFVVCHDIIPGLDDASLQAELLAMAGPDEPARALERPKGARKPVERSKTPDKGQNAPAATPEAGKAQTP